MPSLLSGSILRQGGSNTFINLSEAQPQLPPTPTTSTGYTVITNNLLETTYGTSLGNLQMNQGVVYNNVPNGNIVLLGTGTGAVIIGGGALSTSSTSGALQVQGGLGVQYGITAGADITVNGLQIGQGYQGLNNIVITNPAASTADNGFNSGQKSISVGWGSLQGLPTSYKNIAIGRFALSTGTNLSNSIAIGDSALMNIGSTQTVLVGNITSATQTTPVDLTVVNHGLTSGTYILVQNVTGMTQLNNQNYYVGVVNTNTVALYVDNILSTPVNGTGYGAYSGGGIVLHPLAHDKNIAIGNNAAINLINGSSNFFFGHNIATNFTTGNNNFFVGHDVANNMTYGNSNISIGGDNLQDGLDNQINIGSVFYYNGYGYLQLNSDVGLGIGTTASNFSLVSNISSISQGTTTIITTAQPHGLVGGQEVLINSVAGMTQLNGNLYFIRATSATAIELFADVQLLNPINSTSYGAYTSGGTVSLHELVAALSILGGIGATGNAIIEGTVLITDTLASSSPTTGALVVEGGVGVAGAVNIGGGLVVSGPDDANISPVGANIYLTPTIGGTVTINPNAPGNMDRMTIGLNVPEDGYFVNLHAQNIYGNLSGTATTATNLSGGTPGSIVYQSNTSTTSFLHIGNTGTVLASNGADPYWQDLSALFSGYATSSTNLLISPTTATIYYLGLTSDVGGFSSLSADTYFSYNGATETLNVRNIVATDILSTVLTATNILSTTLTATNIITNSLTTVGGTPAVSTSTGDLVVAGGVGVRGSIYSRDGNPNQGYLLYTPKVTVTANGIPPSSPNAGDFWIDTTIGGEMQYIIDGTSTFWLQITTI